MFAARFTFLLLFGVVGSSSVHTIFFILAPGMSVWHLTWLTVSVANVGFCLGAAWYLTKDFENFLFGHRTGLQSYLVRMILFLPAGVGFRWAYHLMADVIYSYRTVVLEIELQSHALLFLAWFLALYAIKLSVQESERADDKQGSERPE